MCIHLYQITTELAHNVSICVTFLSLAIFQQNYNVN